MQLYKGFVAIHIVLRLPTQLHKEAKSQSCFILQYINLEKAYDVSLEIVKGKGSTYLSNQSINGILLPKLF